MARRLIFDTGVLVAAERGGGALLATESDDDVAIAAVTVAEYQAGVELSGGPRRGARVAFLRKWLETVPVVAYDVDVALVHARLLAHTKQAGTMRGAHDLIIAATAVATGRAIVTTDLRARFEELPGVAAITIER